MNSAEAQKFLTRTALVLLLFVALECLAASDALRFSSKTWQTDDGLPNNSVSALAQTDDGYLWIGTQEGLATFNGMDFSVVQDPQAPHLYRGKIMALYKANDGALWIACDGFGVTRIKEGAYSHYTGTNGLPSLEVRCLCEDPFNGGMWVGTEAGLVFLKGTEVKTYTVNEGLGDNSVRALAVDSAGNLQAATKRGLTSISVNGIVRNRTFPGRWNASALRAVTTDADGDLWAGATDGLYHLLGTNHVTYNVTEGLPDRIINWLCLDHNGRLWVATYGGITVLEDGAIRKLEGLETSSEGLVNVIIEDQERNIWAGTRDGLTRLAPSRFTTFTTLSGLSGNNVMSVLEDSKGSIWLGIWGGGLNVMREGLVRAFRDESDLARDSVLSLLESRDGAIWAGMDFDLGLHVVSNDTRKALPGLVRTGPIRALYEDSEGALWVGTDQGLVVLRQGGSETYSGTNGLSGTRVRVICPDQGGGVWVGTDGGLSRLLHGQITNWDRKESLPNFAVNALRMDEEGSLWIGTLGGGLVCFREGSFTQWRTKDGLFSDEVYEVIEDDSNHLWMSSRRGLSRVAKSSLWEYHAGSINRIPVTVFGKADGLLSVQFNGVAKPAAWKARSGKLWFASIRGVVEVDPRVPTNQRPPPVVIDRVLAGRNVAWSRTGTNSQNGARLTMPPGLRELEIDFSALSLSAPEKNLFSYKLEGADSAWSEPGPQRSARYNKLPAGSYTFKVIACNNDGVWNDKGASLVLRVPPRFWQTWWFRTIMVLVVGGIAVGAYKLRVARLRELEALRMNIAANLHDQVGARLTKVAMITEHVSQQIPQNSLMRPGVEAISRATSDVTKAMDEVVWTINPTNDTLENLANYIFHYAQEYFQDTSVRCFLDFPASLPEHELLTKDRHHLFMTLKEALNNVLKHSKAEEVHIRLRADDGTLRIEVQDDGCGFDFKRAQKVGDGLTNMRHRIEGLGGSIRWDTEPGKGTRVTVEKPLN